MTDEKWINWTLVRRLNHGRMSRALCLEAGDRIEALEAKLDAVERLTRYNCVRGLAGGRAVEPDPTGQFILAEDVLKALQEKEDGN